MAHSRLRKDKVCLNCGSVVPERYCSRCGQENVEPNESLRHLIRHFFEDLTHFDSKFFRFFKHLFFRPGFLTKEYIANHRASHLNPIRAYIFISSVFFLVLFSGKKEESLRVDDPETGIAVRQELADSLRKIASNTVPATMQDSVKIAVINELANGIDSAIVEPQSEQSLAFGVSGEGIAFSLKDTRYRSLQEYDSVQNSLPDTSSLKDKGFFLKLIIRANLRLKSKYGSRSSVVLAENFSHSIPKLMFILLPVFALYLLMFFHRNFYYTQHVIFSIHYHSFVFLLFMVRMFLAWIFPYGWFVTILQLLTLLLMFLYLVFAMKKTYGQSLWLTLLKGLGLTILYVITLTVSFFLLAFITFLLG